MPECVTWSITGDKRITGLCSMELLMNTASSMKRGCPVCVSPVSAGSGLVPPSTSCKTWFIPIDMITPLCAMKFEPVEGQNDCGVCARPFE